MCFPIFFLCSCNYISIYSHLHTFCCCCWFVRKNVTHDKNQCFSKCAPRTGSIIITWLLSMQILRPHQQTKGSSESGTLCGEAHQCALRRPAEGLMREWETLTSLANLVLYLTHHEGHPYKSVEKTRYLVPFPFLFLYAYPHLSLYINEIIVWVF